MRRVFTHRRESAQPKRFSFAQSARNALRGEEGELMGMGSIWAIRSDIGQIDVTAHLEHEATVEAGA